MAYLLKCEHKPGWKPTWPASKKIPLAILYIQIISEFPAPDVLIAMESCYHITTNLSPILKQHFSCLVVREVTTSESRLLYMYSFSFISPPFFPFVGISLPVYYDLPPEYMSGP
jgi:hypothetical protein